MKQFLASDLGELEQRYRARLINSISGFKSANLVGTRALDGTLGASIVSSVVHLGSNPALLGMVIRPPVVPRHAYENILETGCYTLNAVSASMYPHAHQTSARYPRELDEFRATGLEPLFRDGIAAPFVAQSPVQLHLELVEDVEIKHNRTRLLIGSVQGIWLADGMLQPDGFVHLAHGEVMTIAGLDAYHAPQLKDRLSYAKPDQPLKTLRVDGDTQSPSHLS